MQIARVESAWTHKFAQVFYLKFRREEKSMDQRHHENQLVL